MLNSIYLSNGGHFQSYFKVTPIIEVYTEAIQSLALKLLFQYRLKMDWTLFVPLLAAKESLSIYMLRLCSALLFIEA